MEAEILTLAARLSELLGLFRLATAVGIPLIILTVIFALCTDQKKY